MATQTMNTQLEQATAIRQEAEEDLMSITCAHGQEETLTIKVRNLVYEFPKSKCREYFRTLIEFYGYGTQERGIDIKDIPHIVPFIEEPSEFAEFINYLALFIGSGRHAMSILLNEDSTVNYWKATRIIRQNSKRSYHIEANLLFACLIEGMIGSYIDNSLFDLLIEVLENDDLIDPSFSTLTPSGVLGIHHRKIPQKAFLSIFGQSRCERLSNALSKCRHKATNN